MTVAPAPDAMPMRKPGRRVPANVRANPMHPAPATALTAPAAIVGDRHGIDTPIAEKAAGTSVSPPP